MLRSRYERVSRLRRFVARRGKREADDLPSLIAEATRLMLLPSLRDVLGDGGSEPVELRLTYGAACVVIAELLSQRFAPRRAQETATAAIARIGAWSGLDEQQLTSRATATVNQLMETHPEVHRSLCDQFDAAIERAIVAGRPAQGEVMTRLALEAFEIAIQQLVMGGERYEHPVSLIKNSGLLTVVTRRAPSARLEARVAPEEPGHTSPFVSLARLARLSRRSPRRSA